MSEIEYIDGILKRFWVEELPKQYKDNHLLKEDSLKCEIYHYLRCKLENGWLIRHRIRIYPEYLFENGKKADIAIVRLCPKYETNDKYLGDCIEEVIAIIELKYKSGNINKDFYSDVSKLKEYASSFANCQLYAGFIQEYYHDKNYSWFDGRQTKNWAKGRVVELLGYLDKDSNNFVSKINSYNNLNVNLNITK